MVEQKFKVTKDFQPEQRIDDIRVKLREISGAELDLATLKPQVPGYNGTTYVMNGLGFKVSIRHDPDAINVDRHGLTVYVSANEKEEQLYAAIIDIFGLNGQPK